MRIRTTIVLILFAGMLVNAQEWSPRYRLAIGDQYYLTQELSQTTRTEHGSLIGNISLDIRSTLELEVISVTSAGNYQLECRYTALQLDFFAPRSDIAISTSSGAFSPIKTYLNALTDHSFTILMSKNGAFLEITGLDSTIHSLPGGMKRVVKTGEIRHAEIPDREKKGRTTTGEAPGDVNQKGKGPGKETAMLIKKTIGDAFGAAALKSMANTALHFYDDTSTSTCVKTTEVLFNGKPVEITNNLYYNKIQDHSLRVQGVGVIRETKARIELNESVLVTSLKGSQTYDFLCDLRTGWVIEGMSKQKIHSLSGIRDHDELPEGLKIPSVTDSEFSFTGGKRSE